MSSLVEDYATGASIADLVGRPKRFDNLIEMAFEKLNTPDAPAKSVPARNKVSTHKAAIVIEPSSEPEHDEEVSDERDGSSAGESADEGEAAMETDDDMDREGGSLIDAAEVTRVKEEELDFGDSYSGEAVSAGRSTPQSLFSLEVDGLEIVSEPQSRSGSCEPDHSRGPLSPSSSLLSID